MELSGIGIHAPESIIKGDFYALRRELIYYQALGFSSVEISPHVLGIIYNGSLNRKNVAELIDTLKAFSFEYIIAVPESVNFMDCRSDDGTSHQIFLACLEFAALLESAPLVVYRAGRYNPQNIPDDSQKKALWERERAMLSSLGEIAKSYSVTIAIENTESYRDLDQYCYAESLMDLAKMAASINHPMVGVSLDIGRAYLAARHHGFNLLQQLTAIAPFITYMSLNDNFGKCSPYGSKDYYQLAVNGYGNLQLPPRLGEIPLETILHHLSGYKGTLTLRINPQHRQHYGYALKTTQETIKTVKSVNF